MMVPTKMKPNADSKPAQNPILVLLIRHGESEANAGLPTASPTGIRLTAKGHAKAAAVAESIPERPGLIVTSPYLRTQATAAPFIRRYPEVPAEVWPVHEFTYLDIRTGLQNHVGRDSNRTEGDWPQNRLGREGKTGRAWPDPRGIGAPIRPSSELHRLFGTW